MSAQFRADVMKHVERIRKSLAHTYTDPSVKAALDSLEELANVQPVEAEREAIADEALRLADECERGNRQLAEPLIAATMLVDFADWIVARGVSDATKIPRRTGTR